jgi:hypothetical protein
MGVRRILTGLALVAAGLSGGFIVSADEAEATHMSFEHYVCASNRPYGAGTLEFELRMDAHRIRCWIQYPVDAFHSSWDHFIYDVREYPLGYWSGPWDVVYTGRGRFIPYWDQH